MIEILEFYVSGFWVWLGLTVGLALIVEGIGKTFTNFWILFFGRK